MDRLAYLRTCLSGAAAEVLWTTGPESTATYDKLLALLRDRFGNEGQAQKFRAELRSRRQQSGESLRSLFHDIRRLTALAFPGPTNATTEVVACEAFLEALSNRRLAMRVREREPKSLEEALRVAIRMEAYSDVPDADRSDDGRRDRRGQARGVAMVSSETERLRDEVRQLREDRKRSDDRICRLEDQVRNCGQSSTPVLSQQTTSAPGWWVAQQQPSATRPSWPVFINPDDAPVVGAPPVPSFATPMQPSSTTGSFAGANNSPANRGGNRNRRSRHQFTSACHECGATDHWRNRCPKLHGTLPSGSDTTGSSLGPKANQISKTKTKESSGETYLSMQVGTQSVPCLIDTGCELSLVPLKLVSGSTLEPTSQKVYAANESEISILGKTRLHFKLHAQVPTYADVLVTEDIEEPMLGIDWLTKHCSRWDFLTGMLYINGVPLKLVARECRNLCRRVYAVQEITLPARHQGNVAARSTSVNLHDTNMNWALESHRLQAGLMVERSLLPGRHHDLVIRLLNTTDKPQVVGAGTCLGVLQPVQVCGETTAISGSHVDGVATVDRRASFVSNTAGAETCQFCDESDMLPTDRVRVQSDQACSTRKELVNDPFVQMFEGLSAELTDGQRQTVVNLLQEFEDVFSKDDYDLGQTDLVEHRIDTGGHRPFRQTLRRHPVAQLPVIDEHVEQMLQQGIVEPCASPWSSNVVLVRRKDGKYRFCVDYRQLNSITYQDVYPLPRIENCLDALDGASWFSTLDLRSGYWQVRQDPRDADKTAFITRRGCFRFKVMSFGLTNAPSVFQRHGFGLVRSRMGNLPGVLG